MKKKMKTKKHGKVVKENNEKYEHVLKPHALKHIKDLLNSDCSEEVETDLEVFHPEVLYRVDAAHYEIGNNGNDNDPTELYSENINRLPLIDGGEGEFEIGVYRLVDVKRVRVYVEEVNKRRS